jgi:hypothetical protein
VKTTNAQRMGVFALLLAGLTGLSHAVTPARKGAEAPDPTVNLQVEVRLVDEALVESEAQTADRPSYTVATRPAHPIQGDELSLQVANGSPGALSLGRRIPVQWMVAATRGAGANSVAASGAARSGAGGLVQSLTWVDSGEALWVLPHWPGGLQPVQLELHFERTSLRPEAMPSGTAMPAQISRRFRSHLAVPLGVWRTFAATGTPAPSSDGRTLSTMTLAERGRQIMQIRVSKP